MEPLFENEIVCDRDVYKEYYKKICFRRPFAITVLVFFGTCFFASIFLLINQSCSIITSSQNLKSIPESIYFYSVLFPLFLALRIWQYFRIVKISLARDMEMNNGKTRELLRIVTPEKIEIACNADESKISYHWSSVKKVIETKNLIILLTEAKMGIIFKKDGFTKGTYEDFIFFLRGIGL